MYTAAESEKYRKDCLEYMRKLKERGYKIYNTLGGTCDPTNMTINISPTDNDPLQTLMTYWRRCEERYKQDDFTLAFNEFQKETNKTK